MHCNAGLFPSNIIIYIYCLLDSQKENKARQGVQFYKIISLDSGAIKVLKNLKIIVEFYINFCFKGSQF